MTDGRWPNPVWEMQAFYRFYFPQISQMNARKMVVLSAKSAGMHSEP
jgi:hypothetical protein